MDPNASSLSLSLLLPSFFSSSLGVSCSWDLVGVAFERLSTVNFFACSSSVGFMVCWWVLAIMTPHPINCTQFHGVIINLGAVPGGIAWQIVVGSKLKTESEELEMIVNLLLRWQICLSCTACRGRVRKQRIRQLLLERVFTVDIWSEWHHRTSPCSRASRKLELREPICTLRSNSTMVSESSWGGTIAGEKINGASSLPRVISCQVSSIVSVCSESWSNLAYECMEALSGMRTFFLNPPGIPLWITLSQCSRLVSLYTVGPAIGWSRGKPPLCATWIASFCIIKEWGNLCLLEEGISNVSTLQFPLWLLVKLMARLSAQNSDRKYFPTGCSESSRWEDRAESSWNT